MRNRLGSPELYKIFFLILCILCALVCIWLNACSPVSYLDGYKPADLIFQKKVHGGITALVGTELHAPSFSLYADGSVICYQYVDGKRKLVSSRLSESEFSAIYRRIQKNLAAPLEETLKQSGAPITEFFYDSKMITLEGLGFFKGLPLLDTLQEFSAFIDQLKFKKVKKHISGKIVLYVKKLSGGEPQTWPVWKVKEVNPDSIYKNDISFYEPNSDKNSIVLEGNLAKKVQREIEQTSIYQKFTFKGTIYAIGYRPVLP